MSTAWRAACLVWRAACLARALAVALVCMVYKSLAYFSLSSMTFFSFCRCLAMTHRASRFLDSAAWASASFPSWTPPPGRSRSSRCSWGHGRTCYDFYIICKEYLVKF
jgi:hypothetical protein